MYRTNMRLPLLTRKLMYLLMGLAVPSVCSLFIVFTYVIIYLYTLSPVIFVSGPFPLSLVIFLSEYLCSPSPTWSFLTSVYLVSWCFQLPFCPGVMVSWLPCCLQIAVGLRGG